MFVVHLKPAERLVEKVCVSISASWAPPRKTCSDRSDHTLPFAGRSASSGQGP